MRISSSPMKAVCYREYGVDNLKVQEVEKPTPADNEVLVRVRAGSLNPIDGHFLRGLWVSRLILGLRKPRFPRFGSDFAGTVEVAGKNVTQFKPGDDVFGVKRGSLAEFVCARADREVTSKPTNITFEQAASVPIAALTALQGLRDKGRIKAGQKILINGASGGVGTFAVQIAKSFGAHVTGRMQYEECRSCPINRCGPRDRLHQRRFHRGRGALRSDLRFGRQPFVLRSSAHVNSRWDLHPGRTRRSRATSGIVETPRRDFESRSVVDVR
jgi:D-arabinose 1-dehydrogenase-like Zn-dependent alcohol dehydrogenase